jgi:diacylglycerol kinase
MSRRITKYHPYACDTKDVTAGAVLIASLTTLLVGVCIFGPYIVRAYTN